MPQGERYAKAACMTSRKKSRTQSTRTDARLRSPLPYPTRNVALRPLAEARCQHPAFEEDVPTATATSTAMPSETSPLRQHKRRLPKPHRIPTPRALGRHITKSKVRPPMRSTDLDSDHYRRSGRPDARVGNTRPTTRREHLPFNRARLHALSGLTAASQYLSLCRHHMIT